MLIKLITLKRVAILVVLVVIYELQHLVRNLYFPDSPSFLLISIAQSGPNGEYRILRPFCNCSNSLDEEEFIVVEKLDRNEPLVTNTTRLVISLAKYTSSWTGRSLSKTRLIENTSLEELRKEEIACDIYNVLKRGKHQRVVSYSLYGNNTNYYRNFECIQEIVKIRYKGFNVRVHYDRTVRESFRCELECKHADMVDFCNMNQFGSNIASQLEGSPHAFRDLGFMHKMMWRFLPVGDTFVDVFMSRDSDALFTDREIDSVYDWLNSPNYGHVMRGNSIKGYFGSKLKILFYF